VLILQRYVKNTALNWCSHHTAAICWVQSA